MSADKDGGIRGEAGYEVGHYPIVCPVCTVLIEIPVACKILNRTSAHRGEARLYCEPDMTDMWAHMWTHDNTRGGENE